MGRATRGRLSWTWAGVVLAVACGGDDHQAGTAGSAPLAGMTVTTGGTSVVGTGGASAVGGTTGGAGIPVGGSSSTGTGGTGAGAVDASIPSDGGITGFTPTACHGEPAPGALMPPPPKDYTGGACPMLMPGRNSIMTASGTREFLLLAPEDLQPGEKLPLVFFWVWLGGNAMDFVRIIDMQEVVNQRRFFAVVPEKKGDLFFSWPVEVTVTDARREQEYVMFDDILSCVSAQYTVNASCVSSIGVSAGALFTSQLIGGRGDYLASAVVLSGGTGGVIKPYSPPAHKLPVMVLWGGPGDFLILFFEATSKDLEQGIEANGQFLVECVHNCGHAVPPFEVGGPVDPPLDFIFSHPYGLAAGESPYTAAGLPDSFPAWCAIGSGNATPRTGMCMALML